MKYTLALLLPVNKLYTAPQLQHFKHFRQSIWDEFSRWYRYFESNPNASGMYDHNVEKSVQVEGSAEPSLVSPLTPCFVLSI